MKLNNGINKWHFSFHSSQISHEKKIKNLVCSNGIVSHANFSFLVDQVSCRLASWKGRLLNTASRIFLPKSVLASIPTYTSQVIWLPRGTTMCLNRLTRPLFGLPLLDLMVGVFSSGTCWFFWSSMVELVSMVWHTGILPCWGNWCGSLCKNLRSCGLESCPINTWGTTQFYRSLPVQTRPPFGRKKCSKLEMCFEKASHLGWGMATPPFGLRIGVGLGSWPRKFLLCIFQI